MISVLIVEDDPFVSRRLVRNIESSYNNDEVKVVGLADSFGKAVDLIVKERPDMLLLDIQLGIEEPDAGIRLAQMVNFSNRYSYILIMTALEKKDGFELAMRNTSPHDFLQKPFDDELFMERLRIAIKRVHAMKTDQTNSPNHPNKVLYVKTGYREVSGINLNEVSYFEADNEKIHVIFADKPDYYCFNYHGLKNLYDENRTLFSEYICLSRSYLINQNFVQHIKHNHVYLPIYTEPRDDKKKIEQRWARLPIPKNGDSKHLIKLRLGLT